MFLDRADLFFCRVGENIEFWREGLFYEHNKFLRATAKPEMGVLGCQPGEAFAGAEMAANFALRHVPAGDFAGDRSPFGGLHSQVDDSNRAEPAGFSLDDPPLYELFFLAEHGSVVALSSGFRRAANKTTGRRSNRVKPRILWVKPLRSLSSSWPP